MTISEKIKHALEVDGVAILPPMDVFESIAILKEAKDRGFLTLYLKTDLKNYYEKFGATFIKAPSFT